MKKFIFLITFLLIICISAQAKPGDVAGFYYSTDIKTYLNGEQIHAINIDGETLISAEDMYYHSFAVWWNGDTRILEISKVANAVNGAPPEVEPFTLPVGAIAGKYYETDIKTILDGKEIKAYNIGGRTYISAEGMRAFGYVVDWNNDDRTLKIQSAERAGYTYTIQLLQGKSQTQQGIGNFSLEYTPEQASGTGDTDYFDLKLTHDGISYLLSIQFYQNDGLFHSDELQNKLKECVSSGYGMETPISPKEKYDYINSHVKISINGYSPREIQVIGGAGNGHRDFYFNFNDIPKFREDEIESVLVSFDKDETLSPHPVEIQKNPDSIEFILPKLKKNPNDFIHTTFHLDDYVMVLFYESEKLGVVKPRLYLMNRTDFSFTPDFLDEIRTIEGYNYDKLTVFDFMYDEYKHLKFCCSSPEKSGYFYIDPATKTVHEIQ